MSIKKIIDWRISAEEKTIKGVIDSASVRRYDQNVAGDAWVYVCDVKIEDGQTLKNVPIATNNREVFFSQEGRAVSLTRNNGKWSITGLSKVDFGFSHITYVTFTEDLAEVITEDWSGYETRYLTYGELGSTIFSGYGWLPYGTRGRFTKAGVFIEFVGG